MNKADLIKLAKNLTKRIGRAKSEQDADAARIARIKRGCVALELAKVHDVWMLVNAEGETEFVDRSEFEQRMVAWLRRNGAIPRARLEG